MAQFSEPTPLSLCIVRMMSQAIAMKEEDGLALLSHRLPIQHVADRPPMTYTLDLVPDDHGAFLVTCRELPEVATSGDTEEQALVMAEQAIEKAVAARRALPS